MDRIHDKPPGKPPYQKGRREPKVTFLCGHTGNPGKCKKCRREAIANAQKRSVGRRDQRFRCVRLPDGSNFEAVWDEKSQKWAGRLTVPGSKGVTATADGLFTLIDLLDAMFRRQQHQAQKKGPG